MEGPLAKGYLFEACIFFLMYMGVVDIGGLLFSYSFLPLKPEPFPSHHYFFLYYHTGRTFQRVSHAHNVPSRSYIVMILSRVYQR